MQKRVRDTVLFEENNLLCDDIGLFSGIVFFKNKNSYLIANYVDNGVVLGSYTPFCLPNDIDANVKLIDVDSIDFDGERATIFDGETFTGVAIHFDKKGYSYAEEYFDENGMRASEICWKKDMTVKSFYLDHGEISESGEWGVNTLESYSLIGYLSFKFDTEGNVEYLRVDEKVLKLDQYKSGLLKFSPINNIEDIVKLSLSEKLNFSGSYIDDSYISKVFCCDKLNDVKEINLYETNIKDYNFILNLDKVESVKINSKKFAYSSNEEIICDKKNTKLLKEILIDIKKEIKLKNRDIKINFDETEI